jgi:hypothetical protein
MLSRIYTIECDAGLAEGFVRARYCQINTGSHWATAKDARAAARRLKWWRKPGTAVRDSGVDLCTQCAALNEVTS